MSLSLAKNVIVAWAENRPLMLDKTQYSSWASRMLLYIKGKENSKLLVDSVLNGPFKYGTVTIPKTQTTPATAPVANHSSVVSHQSYQAPNVHQPPQASYQPIDFVLVVLSFLPTDDPIVSLNKAMDFISTIFTSRYPPTNNQLRTASNPRNHATIQDGRVTVRQRLFGATTVRRKATWQDSVPNLKGLRIQHDNEDTVTTGQQSQEIPTLAAFQTDDLDAFDFDCDEAPTASAILMAKLSSYDSKILSWVLIHDNYLDNHVIDQNV
ncbi:hypothetical protein Tco_1267978 [Tanacetum coccineum]